MVTDEKFLEDNGFLSEKDYRTLSKDFCNIMNPLRISQIRKNLVFNPAEYETYKDMFREYAPSEVVDILSMDIKTIPLCIETIFHPSYFTMFQNDFEFSVDNWIASKSDSFYNEMRVIDNSKLHSLSIAAMLLDKEIKKKWTPSRFAKKTSVEIENQIIFAIEDTEAIQNYDMGCIIIANVIL